jgi:RNA polymerase sigma factor (sigma-70 family)
MVERVRATDPDPPIFSDGPHMADPSRHAWLGQVRQVLTEQQLEQASDQELLQRFVATQDELPFAALLRRHGALVLGVCRRVLRREQDAEDACQATFLALARQAATLPPHPSLGGWLYRVARRSAVKLQLAEQRRARRDRQAASAVADDPLEQISGRELLAVLDEELQKLPERFQEPLVLCFLEGQTQDEAARQLGWPRGTLKDRLEQGKELLKQRLTRRGLALPAGLLATLVATPAQGAVPVLLQQSVLRGAVALAAGQSLTGVVSAPITELVEGVCATMTTSKLRLAAVLSLVLAFTGIGAGAVYLHALGDRPGASSPQGAGQQPPAPAIPAAARALQLDRFGDPLPEGALHRLGSNRLRHPAADQLAISADGQTVASIGNGRTFLWEAKTGKLLRELPSNDRRSFDLAFSPDGKLLVTSGSYSVQLWNVATGQMLQRWRNEPDNMPSEATAIAFSHDGRMLAMGIKDQVMLHDLNTGKPLRSVRMNEEQRAQFLAFAPDRKSLTVLTDDGMIFVWESATGKELRRAEAVGAGEDALHLSADGRLLASAVRGQVTLSEAATGKELRTIPGDRVRFAPDGKTVATSKDPEKEGDPGLTRLWDVATGKELGRMPWNLAYYGNALFSRDGKIVLTMERSRINLVNGDGKPLVEKDSSRICLLDTATGRELAPAPSNVPLTPTELSYSADGKTLMTVERGVIRSWDIATAKEKGQTPTPERGVSPLGTQVRLYNKHLIPIRFCDAATGRQLLRVQPAGVAGELGVAISPDGKTLALADRDMPIRLLPLPAGEEVYRLAGEQGPRQPNAGTCNQVFYSDDGKLLVHVTPGLIQVLDAATAREVRRFSRADWSKGFGTLFAALSPDNRVLVVEVNNDEPFLLFDLATGQEFANFRKREPPDRPLGLDDSHFTHLGCKFSPDGKMLAMPSVHSEQILIFEVRTGQWRCRAWKGHHGSFQDFAFSPDSKHLATLGSDDTVLVWDLAGLTETQRRAADPESLWKELASDDGALAYEAITRLARSPGRGLPFLQARLQPVPLVEARQVQRWIADLDSENFATRQQAQEELERQGASTVAALKKALAGKPSLELRRRLEQLIARAVQVDFTGDKLRAWRALEAIELMGTAEARQFLEKLAGGTAGHWFTEEARSAVQRLARR